MSQYKINVAQTLESVGAELKIKTKLDLKSPQKEEKEISIIRKDSVGRSACNGCTKKKNI